MHQEIRWIDEEREIRKREELDKYVTRDIWLDINCKSSGER